MLKSNIHVLGDTRPTYRVRCRQGNRALNLTGASVSVLFRKSSGVVVTKAATIVSPATSGVVSFNMVASDVDLVGYSSLEVKVTFSDGGIQHAEQRFPFYVRGEYEEPPIPL